VRRYQQPPHLLKPLGSSARRFACAMCAAQRSASAPVLSTGGCVLAAFSRRVSRGEGSSRSLPLPLMPAHMPLLLRPLAQRQRRLMPLLLRPLARRRRWLTDGACARVLSCPVLCVGHRARVRTRRSISSRRLTTSERNAPVSVVPACRPAAWRLRACCVRRRCASCAPAAWRLRASCADACGWVGVGEARVARSGRIRCNAHGAWLSSARCGCCARFHCGVVAWRGVVWRGVVWCGAAQVCLR
jgi:hypothetical protein